jgi:hypothetical protein
MRRLTTLLFVATCLVGCNWQRIYAFRHQLQHLPHYARWEAKGKDQILSFSQPILKLADLNDLGIYPTETSAGRFVVKYRYTIQGQDLARDTEMVFLTENGRLAAVIFPEVLIDLLGRGNVEALLKLVGGDESPDAGLAAIPKSRVFLAAWGIADPQGDYPELAVSFVPLDRPNRPLTIRFEEAGKPDAFGRFYFDFRITMSG